MQVGAIRARPLLVMPQIWCKIILYAARTPMLRKAPVVRTGLARALSKSGYCSRSDARSLIAEGRVRLNGQLVFDPGRPVALGKDTIQVEGHSLAAANKTYLMMNKPRGIVTTARDERGRPTVYSLLSKEMPWVAPVGRLDKASEGLLLLTNDSAWAARITAPENHMEKTYHVQIATLAQKRLLDQLMAGCKGVDGEFLRVKRVRIIRSGKKNSWLEIVLDEGKNRHIRRLLATLEVEVLRLVRVAIGPLELGDLAKGAVRSLTREEKDALTR
jgi:23S rRNA pseudouridine2605 synthase